MTICSCIRFYRYFNLAFIVRFVVLMLIWVKHFATIIMHIYIESEDVRKMFRNKKKKSYRNRSINKETNK